jgi:aminopeptidase YwaD
MTGFPLLLAITLSTISGDGAFRHAAALSALGPHPWGSARGSVSAAYVAAQFRDAGLSEVRLQPFEAEGLRGSNAIGVLRAPGPEFVVIGAHHDSAPDAPGAYDDGGGVGVLIEMARVLAQAPTRPRTLVFVSFDGEESESQKPSTKAAGSRAYVQSLGSDAKYLVAALVVEMSGLQDGAPVLHPIAYADPFRPGAATIAPAWLVTTALPPRSLPRGS